MARTTPPPATDYDTIQHVYDAYRMALLNVKYHGCRLATLQRYGTLGELVIAVGSSGTLLAIFTGWGSGTGKVVAGALSAAKPVLNLTRRVEQSSRLWVEYNTVYSSLGAVVRDIQVHRALRPEMRPAVTAAQEQLDRLAHQDEAAPAGRLLKRCERETNEEIPSHSLWWPPADASP
jgi:hypothetical protein